MQHDRDSVEAFFCMFIVISEYVYAAVETGWNVGQWMNPDMCNKPSFFNSLWSLIRSISVKKNYHLVFDTVSVLV